MKKTLLFIFLLIQFTGIAFSQNPVGGINTKNPNANTILHTDESAQLAKIYKGVLVARYTTAQRNATFTGLNSIEDGLLIYNTTENCYNYWQSNSSGGTWISICGCGPPPEPPLSFYPKCNEAIVNPTPLIHLQSGNGTVTVNITVTTPGTINAINQTVNGVTFTMAATAVTAATTQMVINYAGTPTNLTNINLPIVDNKGFIMCSVIIPVTPGGLVYTSCATTVAGTYTVETPLIPNQNYITVTFSGVTQPGNVNLITEDKNGMLFSSGGPILVTAANNTVRLNPIASTTKLFPISGNSVPNTSEEVSMGSLTNTTAADNNQMGSYAITNLSPATPVVISCPAVFDVKPSVKYSVMEFDGWGTLGWNIDGTKDSRVMMRASTKYGSWGSLYFFNVLLKNLTSTAMPYSFVINSSYDANRYTHEGSIPAGGEIGSLDAYVNQANAAPSTAADYGAHSSGPGYGTEESEVGIILQIGGKWYRYRIFWNTVGFSFTNDAYLILYGIYDAKPAIYYPKTWGTQTVTTFSKDGDPQSYWP